jgi:hypothetical protein
MGKVSRIARSASRGDFVIPFTGTFLAVLAVPCAILTMLGGTLSVKITSGLIAIAIAVSAILNKRKLRPPLVSVLPGKKKLRCPSDPNLTKQVADLARFEFGRDTIRLSAYETLQAVNAYILCCLVDGQGAFLGYFDVIPLRSSFAELFLQGRLKECDLRPQDVFRPNEMKDCQHLYISGLAVQRSGCRTTNAAILIWGLLKYIEHFYGHTKVHAFASAVTDDGEAILKNFNVPMIGEATARVDRHRMYGLCISRGDVAELLAAVPDYSLLCSLDWSTAEQRQEGKRPARRPTVPHKKRRRLTA